MSVSAERSKTAGHKWTMVDPLATRPLSRHHPTHDGSARRSEVPAAFEDDSLVIESTYRSDRRREASCGSGSVPPSWALFLVLSACSVVTGSGRLRPKLARSADSPGAGTVTCSGEPTVASSFSGSGKVIKK